jgi:DNA polymerase-3 subunit gamma/tau
LSPTEQSESFPVAYTVLARKYRSRTFDEVIGQEPIATTLVNAIKTGRIHHGYLFTGTRGVGKTSMARILAKALNCLAVDKPTIQPCCTCDACVTIGEGQDIDVVEIDAASNTGVDNIRELRSNTAYRPARSRYKIYIIDEVHMLSIGAFNALLKTLEEPPGHVKFILATTEIQKVPATIQSRCQRFNFRNIGPDAIATRLSEIARDEGAQADEAVVRRVARLANGSMRDALSILDQLLSVSPKKLTPEVLDEILPPAQDEQVLGMLAHAATGDLAAVLGDVEAILAAGRGLEVFCNDTIQAVRTLMHVRVCGVDSPIVDVPAASRDDYARLASQFELSHYVQMIAMLEELRRNTRFSGAGRALTDALMVRLARMRQWSSIEQLLGQLPAGSGAPAGAAQKKKPPPAVAAPPAAAESGAVPAARIEPGPAPVARRVVAAPAERPRAAYADVPEAADIPDRDAVDISSVVTRPRSVPGRMPVTAEQRDRILEDPLVQQTLELFEGAIVNMEREVPAAAPETEGSEESTE